MFETPGTVADAFRVNIHAVEQRQPEVGGRGAFFVSHEPKSGWTGLCAEALRAQNNVSEMGAKRMGVISKITRIYYISNLRAQPGRARYIIESGYGFTS